MEPSNNAQTIINAPETSQKSFIEANTVAISLDEIKSKHLIPVFRDGLPVISHSEFIETMQETVSEFYRGEVITEPSIRLSHPIQGRIAEARHKPLQYLSENEKTIYYDRLGFVIEVPTISDEIEGNVLSLTVGGVKAYSLDNLHSNKSADQKFKIFIGFKVKVCSNLKVWTDGLRDEIKINSLGQLKGCVKTLLENYNANYHMHSLRQLVNYHLTEKQFAQVVGRCRLYQHLSLQQRSGIPPLLLNDTQINTVVKEYYRGPFSKGDLDGISLWRFYNLLTEAAKSTYLDSFIEKAANSFQIVEHLKSSIDSGESSWFLN